MKFNKYVSILKEKLSNTIGLPFTDILDETMIQQAIKAERINYRERLYTPMITIWTWLCQSLSKDKSCKNAVSRIISYIAESGQVTPSTDTGAYCKARKRIKEGLILRLLGQTGNYLHQQDNQLWCGRRVFVVDGSTITMDDTEDNQKEYPQPQSQKEGCGFPMANIVATFCLMTGALLETIMSALSTHELNLFRSLYQHLQSGDVALGDRLYGSYADICLLQSRGIDCVFRMHQRRKTNFSKGRIIDIDDHIVQWTRPCACPSGLAPSLFSQLPKNITLREILFRVEIRGYRPEQIILVTTLLDSCIYTKESLAELYNQRWNIETDFRHIKTSLQMEHLADKTPHMVRNDFYIHLLAYNLVRILMFQSGINHGVKPLEISFYSSVQHLLNFGYAFAYSQEENLYNILLYVVSKERIPIRKGRVEPRLIKRRPKDYGWLKQPRKQIKKQLVA